MKVSVFIEVNSGIVEDPQIFRSEAKAKKVADKWAKAVGFKDIDAYYDREDLPTEFNELDDEAHYYPSIEIDEEETHEDA